MWEKFYAYEALNRNGNDTFPYNSSDEIETEILFIVSSTLSSGLESKGK